LQINLQKRAGQGKEVNMKMMEVKEDPQTGDLYLDIPKEMLEELDWKEGDTLEWSGNHTTWYVRKKD
jgi:hypothetical protein